MVKVRLKCNFCKHKEGQIFNLMKLSDVEKMRRWIKEHSMDGGTYEYVKTCNSCNGTGVLK